MALTHCLAVQRALVNCCLSFTACQLNTSFLYSDPLNAFFLSAVFLCLWTCQPFPPLSLALFSLSSCVTSSLSYPCVQLKTKLRKLTRSQREEYRTLTHLRDLAFQRIETQNGASKQMWQLFLHERKKWKWTYGHIGHISFPVNLNWSLHSFEKIQIRGKAIAAQKRLDDFIWKHLTDELLKTLLCPDVAGIVRGYADYETL